MKYELFPHTADIRLKVSGKTQNDLFTAALQGMANIIKKDIHKNKKTEVKEIKIKSVDQTSLLIDFLSEALTASHAQKTIFDEVEFINLNQLELHAIIKGTKTEDFDKDIKAVTYHEAEIRKNASGNLETIIVFDI